MLECYGDMWSVFHSGNFFCITGNSFLKRNGAVVMGRGIAKVARDKKPGLDLEFGKLIAKDYGHLGVYGGVCLNYRPRLYLFQVKRHFKAPADLDLIRNSVNVLSGYAELYSNLTFHLNYPGIGNGWLDKADVAPLLEPLPDNVHVWQYKFSEFN
jgi:hypothetical protein